MNKKVNEKRQRLIQLSNAAKLSIEMGQTEAMTINSALIELYTDQDNTEFKTFKGWKEAGQVVKKGEHSKFLLWSKKRTNIKEVQNEEGETEEKKYKFFGIAYLFSNAQVEPLKPRN